MAQGAAIREYRHVTDEYMVVQLCPVRKKAKTRGAKRHVTGEAQARLNERNARNRLHMQILANFTPEDYAVHPTFDNENLPGGIEELSRVCSNWLRRCKRAWARATGRDAAEFKARIVFEISERGRPHIHAVMSGGLSPERMQEVWGHGRLTADHLKFDENGLCGLTTYYLKNRISYRRWTGTRNLVDPVEKIRDTYISPKKAREIDENPGDVAAVEALYPGWRVGEIIPTSREEMKSGESGAAALGVYTTIFLYREDNAYFRRTARGIDYSLRPRGQKRGTRA
jgi:hypothetical protein